MSTITIKFKCGQHIKVRRESIDTAYARMVGDALQMNMLIGGKMRKVFIETEPFISPQELMNGSHDYLLVSTEELDHSTFLL